MKYERIKFYDIVGAILSSGPKHTKNTHANKRKVQSQTITLSINKNPTHRHSPAPGQAQPICLKSTFQLPGGASPVAAPTIFPYETFKENFDLWGEWVGALVGMEFWTKTNKNHSRLTANKCSCLHSVRDDFPLLHGRSLTSFSFFVLLSAHFIKA